MREERVAQPESKKGEPKKWETLQILGEHTFRLYPGTAWPQGPHHDAGGELGVWAALQSTKVLNWKAMKEYWFWSTSQLPADFVALPTWTRVWNYTTKAWDWEREPHTPNGPLVPAWYVNGQPVIADPDATSGPYAPRLLDPWTDLLDFPEPTGFVGYEVYADHLAVPLIGRVYHVEGTARWLLVPDGPTQIHVDGWADQDHCLRFHRMS